ncbi:MAG: FtsW/RodA/SpoVE family cell cycle protein [Stellaceae bacterium]
MKFARTDQSAVARWWWTVDRWTLAALLCLIGFGVVMGLSASPAVAVRIGYDPLYFVRREIAMVPFVLATIIIVSLQPPRTIRRIALIGFCIVMVLLVATFFIGVEVKGARRWIDFPGLSLQPSEFVKTTFAVVAAWLFSERKLRPRFPGNALSIALCLAILVMLIKQPDIGMTVVVAAVWLAQFYLVGLRIYWVVAGGLGSLAGLVGAYLWLPHVTVRINEFLDPTLGDNYQINRSIQAFVNGGLWGRGPGEGTVKNLLPDAHADFVFAVVGEEFGLIVCLVVIAVFAFIVLRGCARLMQEGNLFVLLAASGLLFQFGLQAIINMATALDLIPTKGMTLPFLSYGGSSMMALALGMGMLIALTRRRLGGGEL